MNIWIVTIGSSDVQLDSNKINREKGRTEKQRSDKVWHYWYGDKIKANCYDIAFEPKRVYKEPDEPYRIEPRILGTVYESSSSEVRDEIWNYLTFPLLDNFTKELKTSPLDAIAVLITDQSEIFPSDNTRGKPKCAYWQDTCTLKLILERYFKGNKGKFPDAKCLWIPLSPASGDKGLDDWNYVLDLVRHKLRDKLDSEEIQVQPNETVYVSHQAGTPAISSAVQFVTLAQFEERVQFLVSNEQDSQFTRFIESSSYLRGIQLEKAKKLLERHDYSGMKDLLAPYLKPEIENLLDAAIQWNFAKFEDFKEKLLQHSDGKFVQEVQERTQKENWWWTAYEAAYLAVVRLKQGNTVEAMFHSFRALEGLAIKYAKNQGENLYSRKVFNYLKQQNLKE